MVSKDNSNIKLLSNYQGVVPLQKVEQRSNVEKEHIKFPQPLCIANYNAYIGRVDINWIG